MADAEYKRLAPHPRACETCEQQFTPKINRGRFCGKSCSDRARKPKEIQCVGCGQTGSRKVRGGSADAGLYCSRDCYFTHKGRFKQQTAQRREALYLAGLSYTAHVRAWLRWRRYSKVAESKQLKASVPCRVCGCSVGYTMGKPKAFCSAVCRKSTQEHKESKRVSKHTRRARLKGVKAESVKPSSVFDRDGWKCQMCGVSTPKSRRGSVKPNAPELDHRHPISKGGDHTMANLQCLCRACNQWKSDKLIPTQQGLFTSL